MNEMEPAIRMVLDEGETTRERGRDSLASKRSRHKTDDNTKISVLCKRERERKGNRLVMSLLGEDAHSCQWKIASAGKTYTHILTPSIDAFFGLPDVAVYIFFLLSLKHIHTHSVFLFRETER